MGQRVSGSAPLKRVGLCQGCFLEHKTRVGRSSTKTRQNPTLRTPTQNGAGFHARARRVASDQYARGKEHVSRSGSMLEAAGPASVNVNGGSPQTRRCHWGSSSSCSTSLTQLTAITESSPQTREVPPTRGGGGRATLWPKARTSPTPGLLNPGAVPPSLNGVLGRGANDPTCQGSNLATRTREGWGLEGERKNSWVVRTRPP